MATCFNVQVVAAESKFVLGILCIDCKYLEIDGVSVLGPLGDVRCNGSHTTVNTTAECSEGCVQMGFSFRHINKQESHTVAYSLRFCAAKRPEGDGCRYMTGDHARKGSTDLRMIGFERFFSYFRTGKFEDFQGVECYCSDEDRCNAEVKNVNPLPTAIVKLYLPWVIIAPVIALTLVILIATGLRVLCLKLPNNLYVLKWNHCTEAAAAEDSYMYDVAISFCETDEEKPEEDAKECVQELVKRLEVDYKVMLQTGKPGRQISEALDEMIRQSRLFIMLVSENYFTPKHKDILAVAQTQVNAGKMKIIAIFLQEIDRDKLKKDETNKLILDLMDGTFCKPTVKLRWPAERNALEQNKREKSLKKLLEKIRLCLPKVNRENYHQNEERVGFL